MGNYVTVADVRAEGAGPEFTDSTINLRIDKWEAIVEKLTKNVFRIIDPGEIIFDGNNSRYLHFNVPIVDVSSIKINDESIELTTDEYRAFTNRGQPRDDRQNPKIELIFCKIGTSNSTSLFTRSHGMFIRGLAQRITARWGYVEPDDSTPSPIKSSIISLVMMDLNGYFEQYMLGNTAATPVPVQRERTDDHEIEYADMKASVTWSMIPNDIRDILMLYRSPMGIGAPEPIRFVPFNVGDIFIGGF